jgi:dTDP-4-dehydrorhamnose 3,5-epimerase-like enzyme
MPVTHENLNIISDSRGFVFEPLTANAFCYQRNAHVVISLPGVIRGNHCHNKGEETIAIMGPALVRFRENEKINDIEIQTGKAYRFTFPPGVPHAIKNLSNQPNVLVAFNSIGHDPQNPDTIEEVLIDI